MGKAKIEEPFMYDIKQGHGRSGLVHVRDIWCYVFYVSKRKVSDEEIGKIVTDAPDDLMPVFGYRVYSPAQLRAIANGMLLHAQRMEEELEANHDDKTND